MVLTKDGKLQSENKVIEEYKVANKNSKKHKKPKKKKKHAILRGIIKSFVIIILILFILILIVAGYAAYKIYQVAKEANISREELVIKHENSIIKDIAGNELGVLNGDENRVNITLNDMPDYLPKAFIAIEDERFYEHFGVDIKRTLGATYISRRQASAPEGRRMSL